MKALLRYWLGALIAIAFVIFTLNNSKAVELSLFPLPYSGQFSLSVIIIAAVAVGVFSGWWIMRVKVKRLKTVHKQAIRLLEDKLKTLAP